MARERRGPGGPTGRRGRILKALVALGLLVALLGAGDVYARRTAESELRSRVRARVPEAADADAHISSFPFVGRLVASGRISEVRIRAVQVAVGGVVRFASITIDAHDVEIDRGRLLNERRVVLTGTGRSSIEAEITASDLTAATGVQVRLEPGLVTLSRHGRVITVRPTVHQNALVLDATGIGLAPIVVRIPRTMPLLPCVGGVQVDSQRILLTCALDGLPAELIGVANRVVNPAA